MSSALTPGPSTTGPRARSVSRPATAKRNRPHPPRERPSFLAGQLTSSQSGARGARTKEKSAAWNRALGLSLLGCVVVLWTASGFLQSAIFADNTYSKPYFVTYFNTACFALPLLPYLLYRKSLSKGTRRLVRLTVLPHKRAKYKRIDGEEREERLNREGLEGTRLEQSEDREEEEDEDEGWDTMATSTSNLRASTLDFPSYDSFSPISPSSLHAHPHHDGNEKETALPPLTTLETFHLSLKFSLLWFIANYFNSACLQYTTVASSTILSTTSSVFTLLFGAITGVEKFTFKKLIGVLACLAGVGLISAVDVGGGADADDGGPGTFPVKTAKEIAIGDSMALISAILYGTYCVLLVGSIGTETRIKMPLFFGFLGLINIICLWPGFLLLHSLSLETFQLPPDGRVWAIVVLNAASSVLSDLCWAYAMLFTSPLVVTVGLSLTIPLSLVGGMVFSGRSEGWLYWVGAGVVVLSFLFINHEAGGVKEEEEEGESDEVDEDELRAE